MVAEISAHTGGVLIRPKSLFFVLMNIQCRNFPSSITFLLIRILNPLLIQRLAIPIPSSNWEL